MERERLKAAAGSRVSPVGVAVGSRALRAVASKESCLVCNVQSAVGKEPVPVTSTELHPKYNSFPPENNTSVYSESSVGICVCERAFASLCPPFATSIPHSAGLKRATSNMKHQRFDGTKGYHGEGPGTCPPLEHAFRSRSVVDDEVGSVSSENTDACSEITDVSLETSASGAGAGVGAGLSYAKHSKEDEDFLMSLHWCSIGEKYSFQDFVASALEVGAERNGGTAKWVQQFEQEVWPAERARQLLGKKGEELELARLLYWWEALSSQTIDPCTDCGLRLCKCPASASCDCVCSSLCSCSREETGARERLWGAFLEASDCVYAIYEFSDARWATYRIEDRDSAGAKGGSKRRLVSPGQAMEEAAATAAEAALAAGKEGAGQAQCGHG